MAAARRVDPSRARQIAVQPFLALAAPAIYAVGTGAKPLVDNLNLIGLNWHRWHFNHTLEEVEGKTYHGGGVEGFADSYGSTVEQPPANN